MKDLDRISFEIDKKRTELIALDNKYRKAKQEIYDHISKLETSIDHNQDKLIKLISNILYHLESELRIKYDNFDSEVSSLGESEEDLNGWESGNFMYIEFYTERKIDIDFEIHTKDNKRYKFDGFDLNNATNGWSLYTEDDEVNISSGVDTTMSNIKSISLWSVLKLLTKVPGVSSFLNKDIFKKLNENNGVLDYKVFENNNKSTISNILNTQKIIKKKEDEIRNLKKQISNIKGDIKNLNTSLNVSKEDKIKIFNQIHSIIIFLEKKYRSDFNLSSNDSMFNEDLENNFIYIEFYKKLKLDYKFDLYLNNRTKNKIKFDSFDESNDLRVQPIPYGDIEKKYAIYIKGEENIDSNNIEDIEITSLWNILNLLISVPNVSEFLNGDIFRKINEKKIFKKDLSIKSKISYDSIIGFLKKNNIKYLESHHHDSTGKEHIRKNKHFTINIPDPASTRGKLYSFISLVFEREYKFGEANPLSTVLYNDYIRFYYYPNNDEDMIISRGKTLGDFIKFISTHLPQAVTNNVMKKLNESSEPSEVTEGQLADKIIEFLILLHLTSIGDDPKFDASEEFSYLYSEYYEDRNIDTTLLLSGENLEEKKFVGFLGSGITFDNTRFMKEYKTYDFNYKGESPWSIEVTGGDTIAEFSDLDKESLWKILKLLSDTPTISSYLNMDIFKKINEDNSSNWKEYKMIEMIENIFNYLGKDLREKKNIGYDPNVNLCDVETAENNFLFKTYYEKQNINTDFVIHMKNGCSYDFDGFDSVWVNNIEKWVLWEDQDDMHHRLGNVSSESLWEILELLSKDKYTSEFLNKDIFKKINENNNFDYIKKDKIIDKIIDILDYLDKIDTTRGADNLKSFLYPKFYTNLGIDLSDLKGFDGFDGDEDHWYMEIKTNNYNTEIRRKNERLEFKNMGNKKLLDILKILVQVPEVSSHLNKDIFKLINK
tara:strand:+ start:50910 stop:53735 length:2826 start_codon:yes stop_codon:yes gene_type:complete